MIASNLKLRWVQANFLSLLAVIANPIVGRLITMLAIENPTIHRNEIQRPALVWAEGAKIVSLYVHQESGA